MFWLKETPGGNFEKLYVGGQQHSLVFLCVGQKERYSTGMAMACFMLWRHSWVQQGYGSRLNPAWTWDLFLISHSVSLFFKNHSPYLIWHGGSVNEGEGGDGGRQIVWIWLVKRGNRTLLPPLGLSGCLVILTSWERELNQPKVRWLVSARWANHTSLLLGCETPWPLAPGFSQPLWYPELVRWSVQLSVLIKSVHFPACALSHTAWYGRLVFM